MIFFFRFFPKIDEHHFTKQEISNHAVIIKMKSLTLCTQTQVKLFLLGKRFVPFSNQVRQSHCFVIVCDKLRETIRHIF